MTFFSERFIVAVLRWTARVIGIAIFLLIVLLIVLSQIFGGIDNPLNMSSREGPVFVAVLVIVLGFVVAWKWEALGSLLIVGGTAFLTIVNYGIQPLVFGTLLLSGLLFLYCWWRTPKRTGGIVAGIVLLPLLVGGANVLNALRERAIGRDCEPVISWVRSSHLVPGIHQNLTLPAEFRRQSADGRVDAVVLEDRQGHPAVKDFARLASQLVRYHLQQFAADAKRDQ